MKLLSVIQNHIKTSTSAIVISTAVLIFGLVFYTDTGANLFFKSSYLDLIRSQGELKVLVRNAPTVMYEGRNGPEGLEYDLIRDFAQYISVKPTFIIKSDTYGVIKGLVDGEGALAAAGLTATKSRASVFAFGPKYQTVKQQVVCRRGAKIPRSTADLVNISLWVTASSSYVNTLIDLKERHPDITWNETDAYDTEQLLAQVWQKKIDCTIADSNIVSINRRYYPELSVAFSVSKPESHAWLLPNDADELRDELHRWFQHYTTSGELEATLERNFGFVELFDYVDIQYFKKQIKKRLPKYKKYFVKAAKKQDLPWTLVAAQSYQESHWRARAKSPTGVRGIMMLTQPTAREMGVKWRLNPKTSIYGGAKYLKKLMKKLPVSVQQPDRTWYALAAYNVGMGHIKDARKLAKQQRKDPDKWSDLVTVLPLLAQEKYHEKLQYGYARGNEPVVYVKRIRNFQDILEKEFADEIIKTAKNSDNILTVN